MILAGDVGGTKTVLALFDERAVPLAPVREATLASRQYARFEDALRSFLGDRRPGAIAAACFGVAGPVVDGRVVTTNLPWQLDEATLLLTIPTPRIKLLNDLEATAHGVLGLAPESLHTLQPGRARPGNIAVIAAGTGLGEALLVWDGSRYLIGPSEGGHADFGPRSEIEIDLLRFLRKDFDHVSYERVVSGPGLLNIYRFVRATSGLAEPGWLAERIAAGDPSAAVAAAGLAGEDVDSARALEIFVSVYGAEAGNLALKGLTVGGVFVAGGIAPKILPRLSDGPFLRSFRGKGRLADLLADIPIRVVLEPRAALLGAARVALDLTTR
ncbi:MAG: glucokinase [Candidatus Rokubacteria bacterium 13_1_40CM_68_15]|nr:MAG: glucokinase [Candidatus Rokubacteria bacterium 13_1_40CM_68_15]